MNENKLDQADRLINQIRIEVYKIYRLDGRDNILDSLEKSLSMLSEVQENLLEVDP